jgi:hypothetical protein
MSFETPGAMDARAKPVKEAPQPQTAAAVAHAAIQARIQARLDMARWIDEGGNLGLETTGLEPDCRRASAV